MDDKTCSVDALAVFVKDTVISTGERISTLRGELGTDFTSAECRQYCQDVGIKREFASEHHSADRSKRACGPDDLKNCALFLADSKLNFLWGELMNTAVFLSNRTPNAARQNGTPQRRSTARMPISAISG